MQARKKGRSRTGGTINTVIDVRTPSGDVQWRVTSRGRVRTIKTSKSSMKVIEEAVQAYGPALTRLANR